MNSKRKLVYLLKEIRLTSKSRTPLQNSGIEVSPQSGPNMFVEPGHFYSPIVNVSDFQNYPAYPPNNNDIEIDLDALEGFVTQIAKLGMEFPKNKIKDFRYFSENDQYGAGDAFTYTGVLGFLKPKKIIEIGSGFSTAVALDWIEQNNLEDSTELTIIEPYPDRVNSLLRASDKANYKINKVQEIDAGFFKCLDENDVLFIDSSHVGKSGSDVLYELFSILPILKPGVWIHFHDVFWPFEYPESWVLKDNRSWNEVHFLRAFLAYNDKFKIRLFNDYLAKNSNIWKDVIPKSITNPGGALWIQVT